MDEIIVRYLNDSATPADVAALKEWRAASADNERHFQQTARVWTLTSVSIPPSAAIPPDVASILDRASALVAKSAAPPADVKSVVVFPRQARFWRRRALVGTVALAASVAAVAISVRLARNFAGESSAPRIAPASVDALRTVRLADGSWVRLAPGARLADMSTSATRAVQLEGRAFFAVAPDSQRPFIVRTRTTATRVLGTRFEVRETDADVRVVVVEGVVEVTVDTARARVQAGSMAVATHDGTLAVSVPADARALLDWSGGLLLFHGTPLADAAREIERWSGYSVVITDSVLARRRVTVAFEAEPLADVVAVVCGIVAAECDINGAARQITVRPR